MSTPKSDFPVGKPLFLGLLTAIVLVVGFGGWASLTNISGAIVASGQIEVDQNRQVVQHPDGGVVSEILVDEGDVVTAGQVVMRLDPTIEQSELSIIEGQLFELMARRGRLEAERDDSATITFDPRLIQASSENSEVEELMDGQERLFVARLNSVSNQIDQLSKRRGQIQNQIEGIDAQMTALSQQLELIQEELTSQQSLLDKGLAQATRVLSLQRTQAQLSGQVGDLTAKRAEAEGRITEIAIQVNALTTQRREDAITRLRDQQYRALELEERYRALTERLSRMNIQAPASGIVYGLTVFTPRSVIRPAEPVLFLIPQDRPLVIAAQVMPIHIDEMYVGQDVILRFSALDSRATPELMGRVTQISADAFQNEATMTSYYRAEIVLNEGEASKLPPGTTLIPGMPVEAFITTQDRTPLAYLVKPFTDYFVKAFRES